MPDLHRDNSDSFSTLLYEKMQRVNPGILDMELYEFHYCLDNLVPDNGWDSLVLEPEAVVEKRVNQLDFYNSIQLKPRAGDNIVLDPKVLNLTRMLLFGLANEEYTEAWINLHFYFDIRGFYFLHRTVYFTENVKAHLGGQPYRRFEQGQKRFDRCQDLGYKDFKEANAEVDHFFIESVKQLIASQGSPILLAIAGPTAAGKTEIVDRLRGSFSQDGKRSTTIEMDNFLTDREDREASGIFSLGKEALHFDLFKHSLEILLTGHNAITPRYDFIYGTSSHDSKGNIKPGRTSVEVESADIIFIEGNFPFLYTDIASLIGIKTVYLTDDPIRMKRKWKRDIDYRKKYEPNYFRNRFFKDQFIMAQKVYIPQLELCDLVVDTTGAALWATPEIADILRDVMT